MTHTPQRGEIWLVALDPTQGSEIKKTRPCLVLSRDEFNKKAGTITIIPITSGPSKYTMWEVDLDKKTGLTESSHVVIPQLRVAAKERLKKHLGKITQIRLGEVEDKLLFYLGIDSGVLTIRSV